MTRSTANNSPTDPHEQSKENNGSGASNQCCSTSCCSGPRNDTETTPTQKSVTIDGQVIKVAPGDKNIVDVADRAKIGIPAPCYRAHRSKGCCNSCVVEVDGEQKFACSTVPENGMNVVVDRADLKAIRKERLMEYKEGIKSGNPGCCSMSDSC
jgi:predicted molibdopterin-dependent oxidoreductase YjgC